MTALQLHPSAARVEVEALVRDAIAAGDPTLRAVVRAGLRVEAMRVALRMVTGRLETAAGRADAALIEPDWEAFENELAVIQLEMTRLAALLAAGQANGTEG